MWEMADTDGRDLARSFYKSLFSDQEIGMPYYERSAGALRDATQKLRGKRGISLERWVNLCIMALDPVSTLIFSGYANLVLTWFSE